MSLPVEPRSTDVSADSVRAAGKIPAVVYGPKQEPLPIAVDYNTFEKLFREAGESTIIELQGLDDKIEVLVKDLTFNAKKGGIDHADFYAIERGKEITTNVALHYVGEAPVEKSGATVNKVLYEVTVTCRPSALPSHIDVDISSIESEEDHLTVADLPVPEGVTIDNDPEDVVLTVSAARDFEAEAPDMDAIEEEAKGKEEGDETEGEASPAGDEET